MFSTVFYSLFSINRPQQKLVQSIILTSIFLLLPLGHSSFDIAQVMVIRLDSIKLCDVHGAVLLRLNVVRGGDLLHAEVTSLTKSCSTFVNYFGELGGEFVSRCRFLEVFGEGLE